VLTSIMGGDLISRSRIPWLGRGGEAERHNLKYVTKWTVH